MRFVGRGRRSDKQWKELLVAHRRSDPTALYHLWGEADVLLYVGISHTPMSRLAQHRSKQPWGRLIDDWEWVWHPNRWEAEAAEAAAIVDEAPLFNIDYNQGRERYWFSTLNWLHTENLALKQHRLPRIARIAALEPEFLVLLSRIYSETELARYAASACGDCEFERWVRPAVQRMFGWGADRPELRRSDLYEDAMTIAYEAMPSHTCDNCAGLEVYEDDPLDDFDWTEVAC